LGKSVVFNQQLIDPKDYDKERIIALKQLIGQFLAVDDNLFSTALQRSASEFLLSKGLDAFELRCTIHQGPQANQASTPFPPQTNQASTSAAPLQTNQTSTLLLCR
jgi:hypothetical protein